MDSQKIHGLIVAGGTGGHIIPGLAILHAFLSDTNCRMRFLSSTRNRNFSDFEDSSIDIKFYDPPKMTKHPIRLLVFIYKMMRALIFSFFLLRKAKPSFVIGMGGYTQIPLLWMARLLSIPYYLCEQNAIPGKATRFFAKGAQKIFINIPFDPDYKSNIDLQKLIVIGNPIKSTLLEKYNTHKTDLSHNQPAKNTISILVLGGSQGALQLNKMCKGVILDLKKNSLKDRPMPKIKWNIQCGQQHLESMEKDLPKDDFSHVDLFSYHSDIGRLMVEADILIARSGAGVLGESSLFSLPMILVPYPWSSDGHQRANAFYYEKKGAAHVLDVREIRSDLLMEVLQQWLQNPKIMIEKAMNSKKLALPDAAQKIRDHILNDSNHS